MYSIKENYLRVVPFSILLVSICLLAFTHGYSYQESQKTQESIKTTDAPINKLRLIEQLKDKILSPQMLLCQITRSGVSFKATPEDEKELREAGASETLITEVRNNYRPQQPPVTSDDICLICRDKVTFVAIYYLPDNQTSINDANKIAHALEGFGCQVRGPDIPSWLKKKPRTHVEPLNPFIIKYFIESDENYAQAMAAYIKKETQIVVEPDSNPGEEDKGKFEVWLLRKVE